MLRIVQNIFLFIVLTLVQVLVLNNVQFLGFINPYIYILFILLLPVRTPRWLVLLLGFVLGLTIDAFSNTLGMHAFSTVLLAYFRSFTIQLFTAIDEGNNPVPSLYSFGVGAYIKYVIVLVLIHHISLFAVEAFSFVNIWVVLLKAISSSAVTILILLGIASMNKKIK